MPKVRAAVYFDRVATPVPGDPCTWLADSSPQVQAGFAAADRHGAAGRLDSVGEVVGTARQRLAEIVPVPDADRWLHICLGRPLPLLHPFAVDQDPRFEQL